MQGGLCLPKMFGKRSKKRERIGVRPCMHALLS
jgi:hypothetical protein